MTEYIFTLKSVAFYHLLKHGSSLLSNNDNITGLLPAVAAAAAAAAATIDQKLQLMALKISWSDVSNILCLT